MMEHFLLSGIANLLNLLCVSGPGLIKAWILVWNGRSHSASLSSASFSRASLLPRMLLSAQP